MSPLSCWKRTFRHCDIFMDRERTKCVFWNDISNSQFHFQLKFTDSNNLWENSIETSVQFSSFQSLSRVWLFATPWSAARQASLSITNSQSLLIFMSIESVMPSNHLILCRPLLLPPSIFPNIRVFSNESVLCIRWPKYWSFSFSISWKLSCSYWMLSWWNWRSFTQDQNQGEPEACVLLSCCERPRHSWPPFRLGCHWDPWNGASCCCPCWVSWWCGTSVCWYQSTNVIKCVNWMYFYEYEPIYRQDFHFTLQEHSNCSH